MTAQELAEILFRRFKGVPGFTEVEALELIEDAMRAHGYAPSDSVKENEVNLVLLYAQSEGAYQIAFSVAHYFRFSDGEESVDKSMVAENYRRLARDLKAEYEAEKGRLHGANFRIMKRVDRPNTMPPTGLSKFGWGTRRWRKF